jgi:hypothetical protein
MEREISTAQNPISDTGPIIRFAFDLGKLLCAKGWLTNYIFGFGLYISVSPGYNYDHRVYRAERG